MSTCVLSRDITDKRININTSENIELKQLKSETVLGATSLSNRYLKFNYSVSFFMQFLYTPHTCCFCAINSETGEVVAAISGRLNPLNLDNSRRPCFTEPYLAESHSVQTDPVPYVGYIYTLVVDPAYRRLGIGRRLIESLIAEFQYLAEAKGGYLQDVMLESLLEDKAAQAFYQTMGFQTSLVTAIELLNLNDQVSQRTEVAGFVSNFGQITLRKTLCI